MNPARTNLSRPRNRADARLTTETCRTIAERVRPGLGWCFALLGMCILARLDVHAQATNEVTPTAAAPTVAPAPAEIPAASTTAPPPTATQHVAAPPVTPPSPDAPAPSVSTPPTSPSPEPSAPPATTSAPDSTRSLARSGPASIRGDYSDFRIIADRNIFNTRRSARSFTATRPPPTRSEPTDSFALVGTLGYEKGWFAFFDGSRPDYRTVIKVDDSIAGYRVKAVGPSNVKLDLGGKEVELSVGEQLRRGSEGEWKRSEQTGASSGFAQTSRPSADDGSSAASTSSTGGSAEESDILKRLMQQREKDLQ